MLIPVPTNNLSLEEIAKKDVPHNAPFVFVDRSQLPETLDFYEAWEVDFTSPDGYGMGYHRYFISKLKAEINQGRDIEKNAEMLKAMKSELYRIEGVTV